MNLSAPCSTPACHGIPPSFFAADGQSALSTPNVNRLSSVEPSVAPKTWKSSRRHFSQFCSGHPGPGSSPPASVPNANRFSSRPKTGRLVGILAVYSEQLDLSLRLLCVSRYWPYIGVPSSRKLCLCTRVYAEQIFGHVTLPGVRSSKICMIFFHFCFRSFCFNNSITETNSNGSRSKFLFKTPFSVDLRPKRRLDGC